MMSNRTEPIKVLQVFASLNVGGAESRMMDIYRKIDKKKIQFDFVTLEDSKQYFEDEISEIGGKIIRLHSPRNVGIINHICELKKCLKEGNYHAVHAHTSYHCGCVMLAAFLAKTPVRVAHARTTGSIQNGAKTKLFVCFGRLLNGLFATNRVAISNEAGKFVFGRKHFDVIPNAIDIEKYRELENGFDYREKFNIPRDSVVIGHVGRFDRFKNQRFVVEWFAQFKTDKPMYLVLVGDGEQRKTIERLTDELRMSDRVVFTGVRSDIPELMKMFDILLFPSIVEGLGGVVLEAQAAGVPSVISNAVPKEVDIGLNLIEICSLDDEMNEWNLAVDKSLMKVHPDYGTICEAFTKRKYSLDYAVEQMSRIYLS